MGDSMKLQLFPQRFASLGDVLDDDVQVAGGASLLQTLKKSERSHRRHCSSCGGRVMNAHPAEGIIDVPAALLRSYAFAPAMHVHSGERVLTVRDGLPKYADLPLDWGGTGRVVADSSAASG
jgi:hypothetical protein